MQQLTTMGLVLRATKTGEADRVLSILTPQQGVISAMAKGSLRLKSKLFSGTGLFCYSEFTLFAGKTMYTVDAASVKEVFWGIHQSVEGMALAMYLAEFGATLAPESEDAQPILRLMLNCLYYISEKKRPPRLIKTIFELRALSLSGFMPDLVACADCVKYEGEPFFTSSVVMASVWASNSRTSSGFWPGFSPSKSAPASGQVMPSAARALILSNSSAFKYFSLVIFSSLGRVTARSLKIQAS